MILIQVNTQKPIKLGHFVCSSDYIHAYMLRIKPCSSVPSKYQLCINQPLNYKHIRNNQVRRNQKSVLNSTTANDFLQFPDSFLNTHTKVKKKVQILKKLSPTVLVVQMQNTLIVFCISVTGCSSFYLGLIY